MNDVLSIGLLIMLTLLVKALLVDNDAPNLKPQPVESNR
jgi:hypothetical protein